ncbi:MAG: hypothetical protein WBV45_14210 [Lutimonas sp.]
MKRGWLIWFCRVFVVLLVLSGCSDEEVDPTFVESEFLLEDALYKIETNMYWHRTGEPGEDDQIRLLQEVSENGETDMIVVVPVLGSGNLEGSYIYSKTGDIRTYNIVYVRDIENEKKFEWITNGNFGSPLTIVRAGSENGKPIYTIQIEDFELNYGFYDFLGDKWVSLGIKNFSFQYQGVIEQL